MIADKLFEILAEKGLSNAELSDILGGRIDIDSIISKRQSPTTEEISAIEKALNVSFDLKYDNEKFIPTLQMSLGEFTQTSKERAVRFIENLRNLQKVMDIESEPFRSFLVHEKKDIFSLVEEIIQSKLSLCDYLQTRGIYALELDRSRGFEGAIYSCKGSRYIFINEVNDDKKKLAMLAEMSSYCLLQFEDSVSKEQADNLTTIFREELLKYLPQGQTFSILAKLVGIAAKKRIISENKAAHYMCVPVYQPNK